MTSHPQLVSHPCLPRAGKAMRSTHRDSLGDRCWQHCKTFLPHQNALQFLSLLRSLLLNVLHKFPRLFLRTTDAGLHTNSPSKTLQVGVGASACQDSILSGGFSSVPSFRKLSLACGPFLCPQSQNVNSICLHLSSDPLPALVCPVTLQPLSLTRTLVEPHLQMSLTMNTGTGAQ